MTNPLDACLEERELRMERTINNVRLVVASGIGLLDTSSALLQGALLWAAGVAAGAVFFVGWALVVRHLTQDRYRPWLKYTTTTVDVALATALYVIYQDAPFLAGIENDHFASHLVLMMVLVNMLSGFRVGRRVIVWSTALTVVMGTAIVTHAGYSPILIAFEALAVALSGLLAVALSESNLSLFVGLRRRDQLARFLPREIVSRVDSGELTLDLGGQSTDVTVLMSDIRGFTSFSESMDPADVVAMLNEYFTEMTRVIFEHGGNVDKFIGDAILAVWGVPEARSDDAARAVQAALGMQDALVRLNEKRAARQQAAIRIGIAVHTGVVVAGGIGSPERMDYTVIGDAVNVAARIEGLTKTYDAPVLLSEATLACLNGKVPAALVADAELRGRRGHVRLYRPGAVERELVDEAAS